jgi:hypothetical protein
MIESDNSDESIFSLKKQQISEISLDKENEKSISKEKISLKSKSSSNESSSDSSSEEEEGDVDIFQDKEITDSVFCWFIGTNLLDITDNLKVIPIKKYLELEGEGLDEF